MKVGELKEQLQRFPDDWEVGAEPPSGWPEYDVESIDSDPDSGVVVLYLEL
jgi:hypothetical protein